MSEEKTYWALIAVFPPEGVIQRSNTEIKVHRFPAKGAKELVINEHIKMFIYFNPVKKTFDVHESKCGLLIGSGASELLAVEDVKEFFRTSNERMFFVQAESFGDSLKRPALSWDEAMRSFEAGLKRRPTPTPSTLKNN